MAVKKIHLEEGQILPTNNFGDKYSELGLITDRLKEGLYNSKV